MLGELGGRKVLTALVTAALGALFFLLALLGRQLRHDLLLNNLLRYHAVADIVTRRHFVHHVQHNAFDDRTQSAGTRVPLDRFFSNRLQALQLQIPASRCPSQAASDTA